MASSTTYAAFSTSIDRCCAFVPPATRANPSFFKFRSIKSSRIELRCNSSGDSGESLCKIVLDAFFLGKAIGDVVSKRIESSVGELVSFIGGLQTEQLKHISQFQEEVLEKARLAKDEATQGAQALVSEAASTVKEAEALVTEATSTVKEATQEVISEAASTAKQATEGIVTEAAWTLEEAAEGAHGLISEAASTAKQANEGIVTEATSTLEAAAEGAHGLISEAVSTAEQATGEVEDLISDAASKVTDVSKTISSITGSVISDVSSSLGIFKKD